MKRYNMPHRSRVVKTRLTDEEYADFTARLAPYGMSQSEFIRQAITRATIRPIVTVSPVNDELLAAVGKLTAEYGRIRRQPQSDCPVSERIRCTVQRPVRRSPSRHFRPCSLEV